MYTHKWCTRTCTHTPSHLNVTVRRKQLAVSVPGVGGTGDGYSITHPCQLTAYVKVLVEQGEQEVRACWMTDKKWTQCQLTILAGAATSIIFVMTKVLSWQTCVCCHNKHMFVATKHILSRQKYACCDKRFGVSLAGTATSNMSLLWQAYFCHDKRVCWDKVSFSRQKFCRDEITFVATNICYDKNMFVVTKDMFCHDKHMLLVAAPASDSWLPTSRCWPSRGNRK